MLASVDNIELLRPLFIGGNLRSGIYLPMLENQTLPAVALGAHIQNCWFQRDRASLHFE